VPSDLADIDRGDRFAFAVKWVASVIQILGYAATGFGLAP